MTAPPDEIVAKVREWAAHADDDLRVAEHTLTLPDECPYRLVAYHAQQCAEKYLKAFLVLRGIDFPFTAQHRTAAGALLRTRRLGRHNQGCRGIDTLRHNGRLSG